MDLGGLRVLVVEDEALVSLMIEDLLQDMGCTVVGPAASLTNALALAESEPLDGALLDLNLGGDPAEPIAECLKARGVPFVFLTGYGSGGVSKRFAAMPTISKPFHPSAIETVLASFAESRKPAAKAG